MSQRDSARLPIKSWQFNLITSAAESVKKHDEYRPRSTLIYTTPDEVHRTFLSINHRLT